VRPWPGPSVPKGPGIDGSRMRDGRWAMPVYQVGRLEQVYETMAPDDVVATSVWLFSHHPHLAQTDRDWDSYRQMLGELRRRAVLAVRRDLPTPDDWLAQVLYLADFSRHRVTPIGWVEIFQP